MTIIVFLNMITLEIFCFATDLTAIIVLMAHTDQ